MAKKTNKNVNVILISRIGKTGAPGDIIQVKRGYANNFLIPRGYVMREKGNEHIIKDKISEWQNRDAAQQEVAKQNLEKLQNVSLKLKRESGIGGSLYGSVSARDVAKALLEMGVSVEKKEIEMDIIKFLGNYKVKVNLYGGLSISLDLSVAPIGS